MPDPNLLLLEDAAEKLQTLLDNVVFVGGATVGSLISDAAAAPIRVTKDVDVIVKVVTGLEYAEFSERLRVLRFKEDEGMEPVLCRWHNEGLILDAMPLEKSVLGFTNCWYQGALDHAAFVSLRSGRRIRMITAPYF